MSLVPPFSWFVGWRWQRARVSAGPDFGDMGTAFGLDASIDSEPPTTVPAVFMKNGRPGEGAPDGQTYHGADRRMSLVDLREGQLSDRRSRV